jgi:hypothetical protein
MTREARLKHDYAALYPCVRPGVWQPAAVVVDRLLACMLEHPDRAGGIRPGRVIRDEHFEFRGVSARAKPCATRCGEW